MGKPDILQSPGSTSSAERNGPHIVLQSLTS